MRASLTSKFWVSRHHIQMYFSRSNVTTPQSLGAWRNAQSQHHWTSKKQFEDFPAQLKHSKTKLEIKDIGHKMIFYYCCCNMIMKSFSTLKTDWFGSQMLDIIEVFQKDFLLVLMGRLVGGSRSNRWQSLPTCGSQYSHFKNVCKLWIWTTTKTDFKL